MFKISRTIILGILSGITFALTNIYIYQYALYHQWSIIQLTGLSLLRIFYDIELLLAMLLDYWNISHPSGVQYVIIGIAFVQLIVSYNILYDQHSAILVLLLVSSLLGSILSLYSKTCINPFKGSALDLSYGHRMGIITISILIYFAHTGYVTWTCGWLIANLMIFLLVFMYLTKDIMVDHGQCLANSNQYTSFKSLKNIIYNDYKSLIGVVLINVSERLHVYILPVYYATVLNIHYFYILISDIIVCWPSFKFATVLAPQNFGFVFAILRLSKIVLFSLMLLSRKASLVYRICVMMGIKLVRTAYTSTQLRHQMSLANQYDSNNSTIVSCFTSIERIPSYFIYLLSGYVASYFGLDYFWYFIISIDVCTLIYLVSTNASHMNRTSAY